MIQFLSGALLLLKMEDLCQRLELVITNPLSRPPDNPNYGKQVKGFTASRIFSFNGKLWQMRMRSIRIIGNWFIFPFIIDTGGPQNRMPILSDPILKKFKLFRASSNSPDIVGIPSPFGYSQAPLTGTWGDSRAAIIQESDLKFNAFGSSEAQAIICLSLLARVQNLSTGEILKILDDQFEHLIDPHLSSQEIESVRSNLEFDWSSTHLPILSSQYE
jgi:hypothetical protein